MQTDAEKNERFGFINLIQFIWSFTDETNANATEHLIDKI